MKLKAHLKKIIRVAKTNKLLVGLLAGLLLVAVILVVVSRGPAPEPEPALVTRSSDEPSETKPNPDTYQWKGAKNDPKFIEIPGVAEGFIQRVGVDQHKAVAVPSNIHMAGWFVDSVRPGDKGLSIIDGHVDGRTQPGIFTDLAKAKPGTEFTVTFGDDSVKKFRIAAVKTVATDKAENELFSQDPTILRQLNLITCGGTFDKAKRSYDERVIVSSELVE